MNQLEFVEANREWGANCGPGALAAILKMSMDDLRPHMGDFEKKHYTNPKLMFQILDRLKVNWRRKTTLVSYGLVRIRWEGEGTSLRDTHWIGVNAKHPTIGIFDINALGNDTGWCSFDDWRNIVAPHIIKECVPKGNGKWHITHAIEIEL